MKYSAILLSAIASGAMAAPQRNTNKYQSSSGTGIIKLDDKVEHSATNINNLSKFSFGGFGGEATFAKVALTLDKAKNDKLRCKATDKDGNPFVVFRKVGQTENTDFTFAKDAPWTFQPGPAAVAEVICDAEFKQIPTEEQENIVIELSVEKDSPNPVPITLKKDELEADVPDKSTEFNYVTLKLGPKAFLKDGALRCQLLAADGTEVPDQELSIEQQPTGQQPTEQQPIEVNRGANLKKITFADGFKGAWKFTTASRVSKIVCGDKIVKADPEAPAAPPATGDLPPVTGDLPPVTGDLPPVTGDLPPVTGDVPPLMGSYQREQQN